MIGKVPPNSKEAEKSVLWSILIDNDAMVKIAGFIDATDFYDTANSLIFGIMLDLFKKWKNIDLVTVKQILEDKKKIDNIWWVEYLVDLTNSIYTSSNIFQYAQIVKDKSVLRKLIKVWSEILNYWFEEESEINNLLEKSEQSLFWVTQNFIQNKLFHIRDIASDRYNEFSEISQNPEYYESLKVKTWYKSLDRLLGGLKPGDMVILAARPSMWKTALALNIAEHVWANKKNVAVFSLEMSKEQLTDRIICSSMWIDGKKLNKWELDEDDFIKMWDALEKLSKINIYIDDSCSWSLLEIKSKARRLKMESWLDFVVIDYLQLISNGWSWWNSFNRVQEMSDISRWIKSLARELWVPILALSQLSRAVESRTNKEPVLSDLRESWSIEQDADVVLMIYREDYYNPELARSDIPWKTEIFIRKNRNGPIGTITLNFERKYMKFIEIDTQHGDDHGWGNPWS